MAAPYLIVCGTPILWHSDHQENALAPLTGTNSKMSHVRAQGDSGNNSCGSLSLLPDVLNVQRSLSRLHTSPRTTEAGKCKLSQHPPRPRRIHVSLGSSVGTGEAVSLLEIR